MYLIGAAVAHVLQTLADGRNIAAVTVHDDLIYVLCHKLKKQIEVYDRGSYDLQRYITVPGVVNPTNIVICAHNHCGYISDMSKSCVHRLALRSADVTQWPVSNSPVGLSVTDTRSLLVTCDLARSLEEFTTDGHLVRRVKLYDVTSPNHAIQLSSGEFIVCDGNPYNSIHRVCLVNSDGEVVRSYGSQQGSGSQQVNTPTHVAVDRDGFV